VVDNPGSIASDLIAMCVREWLGRMGVKKPYLEPGSPWENGSVEGFNGKLRDELQKRVSFDTLLDAKVLVKRWQQDYNSTRPDSALGHQPTVHEALQSFAVG
jgi:putative transposase